ncbi:hypothetical protein [Terriglobus tenax]|uniref:hypothetical protein n=1 Tax=Terriglobus tenax TaxID=1111115 RepID=UPI0021DF7955|nr:hypothetical protein [Terriglobus tenax]
MSSRILISGVSLLLCLGSGVAQQGRNFSPGAGDSTGTALKVRIQDAISSKDAQNGQFIRGVMAEAATVDGHSFPAGTLVEATVVSTSRAGQLTSAGELSLQVEKVGEQELLSDVTVVTGKEGAKDLPDSAPEVGTEAEVQPQSVLIFHVVPLGLAYRDNVEKKLDLAHSGSGAGTGSSASPTAAE